MLRPLVLVLGLLALAACTGERRLPAPPAASYEEAVVAGFPDARVWGDRAPEDAAERLQEIRVQTAARVARERKIPNKGRFDVLVLSGGGTDGAFGSGVLNAWSDYGDRPEFGLVTGISTGALIAPYAFLGPEFDADIERVYTNIDTDDVLELNVYDALVGNALGVSDPSKLAKIVEDALTPRFVARIAAEHRKGRRLWIGTTNLDAQRPVTWDIGAIAQAGTPQARALIRDVLIASASIPGAFPPVEIPVVIGPERFVEMHVDGGVTRQLFLYPSDLKLSDQVDDNITELRRGTIWIIRNSKLAPEYGEVAPGLVPIARRSISTLLKAAGVADVLVIEAQAERDGWGLRRIAVPETFRGETTEPFDPVYMRSLYEAGYELGRDPDAWETAVEPRP